MNLLSNVVPGLRDFRTPWTSGLLWLLLGWLLLRGHVDAQSSPELFEAASGLEGALTQFGAVAAISSGAYLVGTALEFVWSFFLSRLPQVSRKGLGSIRSAVANRLDSLPNEELACLAVCHPSLRRVTEVWLLDDESRPGPLRPPSDEPLRDTLIDIDDVMALATPRTLRYLRPALAQALNTVVLCELDMTGRRLIVKQNHLFQLYDRLRSESEFRMAILVPLAGLVYVVMRWQLGVPVALLLAVVVALIFLRQSWNKRTAAGDALADALLVRDVDPPALESIERGVYTFARFLAGEVRPATGSLQEELDSVGIRGFQRILYVLGE